MDDRQKILDQFSWGEPIGAGVVFAGVGIPMVGVGVLLGVFIS